MRIAISITLWAMFLMPRVARAQVSDLADKVEQLTAQVRASASELRPLYQDSNRFGHDGARAHKPRGRRGRNRSSVKPIRAEHDRPVHISPRGSSR